MSVILGESEAEMIPIMFIGIERLFFFIGIYPFAFLSGYFKASQSHFRWFLSAKGQEGHRHLGFS